MTLALSLGAALSLLDALVMFALVRAPSAGNATMLLLCHLGIAALGGVVLLLGAPSLVRRHRAGFLWLVTLLCAFVPVAGPLGAAALTQLGLIHKRLLPDPAFRLEAFPRAPLKRPVRLGRMPSAVKIASVLRNQAPETADRRFRSVLLTRALPTQTALHLLRSALRDPSDEVRLFAFSRIEHVRDELETSIRGLEHRLDVAAPHERGVLSLRLAESHFQLCEYGLADGAVHDMALEKARVYAADATESLPDGAAARMVLSRVLLRQRRWREAEPILAEALWLGYPAETIVPLQAECAFRERDFARVGELLRTLGTDRSTMPVGALSVAPASGRPTRPSLMNLPAARLSAPPSSRGPRP